MQVNCKSNAEQVVIPGTYYSTETVPGGWDLTDISCDDDNSAVDKDVAEKAVFRVEAGETVMCIFTNIPLTKITVTVNSLATGGTASTIDCKLDATTVGRVPLSEEDDPLSDPTLTLDNRKASTYVCTVVVDGDGPP